MRTSWSLLACSLLAALPLAVDVAAQSPQAVAVKAAKSGAKAVLAEYKTRSAEALAEFLPALDALVAGLQADQFGTPLLHAFRTSAQDFQVEMALAVEEADAGIADAFSVALQDLAVTLGEPLDGVFPDGFLAGDRGAFDDAHALLAKAIARSYAKLGKKLESAMAKAQAADVGLTLQFFPPPRRSFNCPTESQDLNAGHNPVLVFFIVGVSRLDVPGDGVVLVGGTGLFNVGDVSVLLFAFDALGDPVTVTESVTATQIPVLNGVWSMLIDDEGEGLREGDYVVEAFFPDDLTSPDGLVGVP